MLKYLFYSKDYCHMCLENKTDTFICNDCKERLKFVSASRDLKEGLCLYPLFYNNFIKDKIKKFKYESSTYLAKTFVEILYEFILAEDIDFDYISYISMYKKDEYDRGYNQSKLLADLLALKFDKKLVNLADKIKSTKHQNKLDKEERKTNLQGAYRVRLGLDLENKTILIVDDLVTTGSTFSSIGKLVKEEYNCDLIFLALASSRLGEEDEE
ncbi:ComF family protein [Helcococcus massiliensis]|uniref:ComF family protein n=1 Tax=Helcococcus massiliensis TaxID=2040290 RepID=UPI000CDEE6A2|nr:phosphoribosyltransferase family protein [Helcococcus massiliensis]